MAYPHAVSNRDYSQMALRMSVLGTVLAIVLIASRLQWIPDLTIPAASLSMLAICFMRIPRQIDDFVSELWMQSADNAFFMMIGTAMVAIAAGEHLTEAVPQVGLLEWPFFAALLTFYATYHFKRWRSA